MYNDRLKTIELLYKTRLEYFNLPSPFVRSMKRPIVHFMSSIAPLAFCTTGICPLFSGRTIDRKMLPTNCITRPETAVMTFWIPQICPTRGGRATARKFSDTRRAAVSNRLRTRAEGVLPSVNSDPASSAMVTVKAGNTSSNAPVLGLPIFVG